MSRISPIDVVNINGRYIIFDGHHRARAAIKAGLKEVPIRVVKPLPNVDYARQAAEASGMRDIFKKY